jgi:hypothetical protein
MLGDPHPRSGHRASPASGLALLTPQALVRQAQAGQARARQAIVRQAMARQARGHRAPEQRRPALGEPALGREPAGPSATDQQPAGLPAMDSQPHSLPAMDSQPHSLPALGLQAVVRLAAEFQAAEQLRLSGPEPDRPTGSHHRQPRGGPRPVTVRQRRAPQRRALREPQQAMQSVMSGLAALIVLAIVGLSTYFIVAEGTRGQERESAAPPAAEPAIASREVDAEPLTQDEVFPQPTVQLALGVAGYQVTMTHSDSECRIATTGELGALLRDYGCDQVVRARLTAPYGGYQVTTGIFNLADETGAARVSDLAHTLVETGRGTFATLGGAVGDPLAEPLAQVGWYSRGHYLLYCVIARPDGQLVTDDDPYPARITAELVEEYLGEQIVGYRLLGP